MNKLQENCNLDPGSEPTLKNSWWSATEPVDSHWKWCSGNVQDSNIQFQYLNRSTAIFAISFSFAPFEHTWPPCLTTDHHDISTKHGPIDSVTWSMFPSKPWKRIPEKRAALALNKHQLGLGFHLTWVQLQQFGYSWLLSPKICNAMKNNLIDQHWPTISIRHNQELAGTAYSRAPGIQRQHPSVGIVRAQCVPKGTVLDRMWIGCVSAWI